MTEYQDNSQKYTELRNKYPIFVYEDFKIDSRENRLDIHYHYRCSDKKFVTDLSLSVPKVKQKNLTIEKLYGIIFNMGLVELISYWKAFCSPIIEINCGNLDEKQKMFYKKMWFNGLGEFFYLNNIATNQSDFVDIQCTADTYYNKESFLLDEDYIVPIGGGKDSVVTLELLRGKGKDITPMVINSRGATDACIKTAGFDKNDVIEVSRKLDPLIVQLNKEGYLNGHTPFSAMLAFTTLLCAAIYNKRFIALSNENSANEATDLKSGVNHQYSKSLEFENDFRDYYKEYICSDIEYFSLLRPIKEIFIAKIFALLPYKDVFKSCNAGSKEDKWCLHCPKCLFAFIILSPFVSRAKLMSIFGTNLFADESLLEYFNQLTGLADIKPFECVGTIEEVNLAISMVIRSGKFNQNDILLKTWVNSEMFAKYVHINPSSVIFEQSSDNNLPKDLNDIFDNYYYYIKVSELIRKYKKKNIMIMGLGREGLSTLKLFNTLFKDKQMLLYDNNPAVFIDNEAECQRHVQITDKETLKDNIAKIKRCIVFMSPGLAPKDYPYINMRQMRNQCSVFLDLFSYNCVGVSGTKGKSTTTQLLYHIMKESYNNAVLAGNMGIPFFDVMHNIKQNTCIILELSSHQLQLINKAPHISVLLNLYEEHLDHYNSFEEYCMAKLNLLKKSIPGDYFVYNQDDALINHYIDTIKSNKVNKIPFSLKEYTFRDVKFLKGDHNKMNILAVLKCARILHIHTLRALRCADNFQSLPHRLEFIGTLDGVKYYDDSISTIPQATLAALKALEDVSVLILGGMDRGIDYSEIKKVITEYNIRNIAFVGLAGRRMFQIMKDDKLIKEDNHNLLSDDEKMHTIVTDNWYDIVKFCKQHAVEGTSVLLSPAASSYDQFKNFEHRGDYFKSLVFQKKKY